MAKRNGQWLIWMEVLWSITLKLTWVRITFISTMFYFLTPSFILSASHAFSHQFYFCSFLLFIHFFFFYKTRVLACKAHSLHWEKPMILFFGVDRPFDFQRKRALLSQKNSVNFSKLLRNLTIEIITKNLRYRWDASFKQFQ